MASSQNESSHPSGGFLFAELFAPLESPPESELIPDWALIGVKSRCSEPKRWIVA